MSGSLGVKAWRKRRRRDDLSGGVLASGASCAAGPRLWPRSTSGLPAVSSTCRIHVHSSPSCPTTTVCLQHPSRSLEECGIGHDQKLHQLCRRRRGQTLFALHARLASVRQAGDRRPTVGNGAPRPTSETSEQHAHSPSSTSADSHGAGWGFCGQNSGRGKAPSGASTLRLHRRPCS